MLLFVIGSKLHIISTFSISGYSIFVVVGKLPESEADQLLKLCPAKPEKKPSKTTAHTYVNKSDLTAALQQVTKLGGEGKIQVIYLSLLTLPQLLLLLVLFVQEYSGTPIKCQELA